MKVLDDSRSLGATQIQFGIIQNLIINQIVVKNSYFGSTVHTIRSMQEFNFDIYVKPRIFEDFMQNSESK
jgi:hypothetical protein